MSTARAGSAPRKPEKMITVSPAVLADLAPTGTFRAGINMSNFLLTARAPDGKAIGVALDLGVLPRAVAVVEQHLAALGAPEREPRPRRGDLPAATRGLARAQLEVGRGAVAAEGAQRVLEESPGEGGRALRGVGQRDDEGHLDGEVADAHLVAVVQELPPASGDGRAVDPGAVGAALVDDGDVRAVDAEERVLLAHGARRIAPRHRDQERQRHAAAVSPSARSPSIPVQSAERARRKLDAMESPVA